MSFNVNLGRKMMFAIVCVHFASLAEFSNCQEPEQLSDRCLKYAKSIEELDRRYSEHLDVGHKLISERQETLNRLVETNHAVAKIVDAKVHLTFELAQSQWVALSIQAERNGLLASSQPTGTEQSGNAQRNASAKPLGGPQFNRAMSTLAKQNTEIQVYYDMVRHQLKTFSEAGKLAVQRHMSQMGELERIATEMSVWDNKNNAFFNQYWELADVDMVKSDLELQAAIEQLKTSSHENPGAVFLKAVTLTRLEQYDEALPHLARLADVRVLHGLLLALRAEILTRTDKKREAEAALRQTLPLGLKDPRVRMHRAVALAASGQFKLAELEWEAIIKLGGHEIAARRGIAWINGSAPTPTNRIKSKAIENANLATQLGGDDWSCEIAFAIAAAANGQLEKAIESARKASKLTIGTNQAFCERLIEQLNEGNKVSWRF